MTNYKQNLITGRIRRLLEKKPDAGYDDLAKIFYTINRSIRVIFYQVHKEMYGYPGSLKRSMKRQAPVREIIVNYFTAHPDHTINQAARALNMNRARVYANVYNAIRSGEAITFRKSQRKQDGINIAKQVRDYFQVHPEATSSECAKELGTRINYVCLIMYRARQNSKKCKAS